MTEKLQEKKDLLQLEISARFDKLKADLNGILNIKDAIEYKKAYDKIITDFETQLNSSSLYIDTYIKEISKTREENPKLKLEDIKINKFYYKENSPTSFYNFENQNLVSTGAQNYNNEIDFIKENKHKLLVETF